MNSVLESMDLHLGEIRLKPSVIPCSLNMVAVLADVQVQLQVEYEFLFDEKLLKRQAQ